MLKFCFNISFFYFEIKKEATKIYQSDNKLFYSIYLIKNLNSEITQILEALTS